MKNKHSHIVDIVSIVFLQIFFIYTLTVFGESFVVGANGDFGDQNPGNDTITFAFKLTFSVMLPEITDSGLTINGSSQGIHLLDCLA